MDDLIKRDAALKGYDTVLSILDSAVNAVSEAKAIVLQYGSEPEQRWIPFSERFPESNETVLVQFADNDMDILEFPNSYRRSERVAWMPLPEPWRGEGGTDEKTKM